MKRWRDMIGAGDGLVGSDVFSAAAYERELERLFTRCWLFLGHASMIPSAHDYFLSQMGLDSVIVKRDAAGRIRAFLNKCRHRGAEICLYDSGNARAFTCAYHGWRFGEGGELIGVPYQQEAYGPDLDRSKLGLIEVPRIATFGGLIFANWDENAGSLEDYLGDAKWWLENFLLREEDGGLEVVPGAQRYMMPANWKLHAENFAGDSYHVGTTHGWMFRVRNQPASHVLSADEKRKRGYSFSSVSNHGRGAPHGFLEIGVGAVSYEHDLAQAQSLGPEAVEWVRERQRRLDERLKAYAVKPYSFHAANIFPNFGLIGVQTAMYAKGLFLFHPAAPNETEVWLWCAVEKSAPPAVKKWQKFVLAQRQAAAGIMAPDDHETIQRIANNARGAVSRSIDLHYAMGLGRETDDPRPDEWREERKWPGRLLPQYSEAMQRDFYRYWAALMEEGRA